VDTLSTHFLWFRCDSNALWFWAALNTFLWIMRSLLKRAAASADIFYGHSISDCRALQSSTSVTFGGTKRTSTGTQSRLVWSLPG
jgi:hypothetical protein